MRFVLCALLLLAGCNTPGPYFRDVPASRVTMGALVWDVRVKGALAEAVRVNPQYAPRLGPLARRAELAMEAVSGCDVTTLSGDQALVLGALDCGRDNPRPGLRPAPRELECEMVEVWVNAGLEQETAVLECEAVS